MSITVDKIQLEIAIKHDQARQEIADITHRLEGETKQLEQLDKAKKKAMKEYKDENHPEVVKITQAYEAQSQKISELKARKDELRASLKVEGLSLSEVRDELKKYNMILSNLTPGTEAFNETKSHVDELKSRLKDLNKNANDTSVGLGKFLEGANRIGFAITNALAIKDRIVAWADQYVQAFAKMDDAMTDVMKYTGQTKAEVEDMNEAFKQMTTRTAREELNALAGAAGRLGIQGKENIIGFVDAADKINVALGDDLGEGAIDQIGKLTMVFGEDKTKGLNGAMLATGSAINVLGANSSANTGFITEFTSSMAGMAVNAKISQTNIMGYASALSQAGIEGQTASGVFAQLITKMFTDPAKFAKAAKLDVQAFTDLLKTDANQAILQFLEGLKANGGFDALAPALKSLKMQGTQAVPVISSLINKMDELKKAQADARQAYDEGTSIIEEFNNANSSAAAKLEMAQKAMNDVAADLGKKLLPIVEGGITMGTTGMKLMLSIIGIVGKFTPTIAALTATIVALTVAENAEVAVKKLKAFWNEKVIVSTKNLWAVLRAHPYAAIIGAITIVATLLYDLTKKTDAAAAAQKALNKIREQAADRVAEEESQLQLLITASKDERLSKEERFKAIEKLEKQIPGYVTELDKETGAYKENKKALDDYLLSLSKKYEVEGAKERLKELGKEIANLRVEQNKAKKAADAANSHHRSGGGYSYTTSWGAVGNTAADVAEHENARLDKANKDLEAKEKEREEIYSAFGLDLHKEATGSGTSPQEPEDEKDPPGGGLSDKEKSKFEKRRKELEAQAKAEYEREKILLREQYQNKKQEQDKWHEEEFQAEQKYINRLAEIRKDYGASESDRMEVQNMMLDSLSREANRKEEVKKRKHQETMETIDREQAAAEIGLARQRLDGEIATEEEYSRRKLEVEIEYQRKRVMELKTGSAEYQAAQKQLLSLELQQLQQNKKDDNSFKSDFQSTNNRMLHNNFEGESFERMRELNEEYREKDLISYQQYQENLSEIAQAESDKRQAIQQAAVDGVSNLLSSASQLFSAMQQRETAAVDAKYKKLIASAKKQGKDTTKLEEQQEAEKQAIAKKYADRNFQIQVLQIVGNTAQGISKTIAELGMPWAVPFVAMAAAAGAMQLASAKAAADQASGLYSGGFSDEYQEGYTRKGDPRKQAGVIPVHQNEFVANHKAVANPNVRPVLDVIDRHQKVGDIQMLDSTRMLEEAYGRGRYRGGYVQPDAGGELSQGDGFIGSASDNSEAMQLLRTIARNTGTSLTVRGLRREIRHEEQLEKNASR